MLFTYWEEYNYGCIYGVSLLPCCQNQDLNIFYRIDYFCLVIFFVKLLCLRNLRIKTGPQRSKMLLLNDMESGGLEKLKYC